MVCRTKRDDGEMVRAGRDAYGSWYLGRGAGRGVWWCDDAHCEGALSVSHLARALRATVTEADAAALRGLTNRKRL